MIDGGVDQAALAADVRAGRWAEVRIATAAMEHPLPPAVALVAARAAASGGEPARALELLRDALPHAGELAAALRLEAGAIAVEQGETPWPWVVPLLRGDVPSPLRRAAGELLRRSWQRLPVRLLREQQRTRSLSRALRRSLEATIAVRAGDVAMAIRALRERTDDEPAARVALWLRGQPDLPDGVRLALGEALVAAGYWREAEDALAPVTEAIPEHQRGRLAFVRGRAAYRRGKLATAAGHFDDALAHASDDEERFAAAVQRARVAELSGDRAGALPLWDTARHAAPAEVEGWDGGARSRAALGRGAEAAELLRGAPPQALRIAGPRLAALLLARGEITVAGGVLARVPRRSTAAQVLLAALAMSRGDAATARPILARLLGDRRSGAWRSLALSLLPGGRSGEPPHAPIRDAGSLAELASARGAEAARGALSAALAADPLWRSLLAGEAPAAPEWSGPARQLAEVGLEAEAALVYADRFPAGSPSALAWSARTLAAWGNGSAALATGERLLALLGNPPPALLPDALLPFVLPPPLTTGLAAAAGAAGVPPSWLAGVVRRESRFDRLARSRAGAVGIAQIVPETARRLGADPAEALEEQRALDLAAGELARIASRFEGRLVVVAAAYNAGDEVVASWLATLGGGADDLLFAAAVPYGETAEYVLHVVEGAALARYLE